MKMMGMDRNVLGQSRIRRRLIDAMVCGMALLLALPTFACDLANIRFSSSSNRVYVENGGICSLSQISTLVVAKYSSVKPNQVLEQFAPNRWLLKTELNVEGGSTLKIHGTEVGGDADELRLLSRNGTQPYHVRIQAKYGTVELISTNVTSWDTTVSGPDTVMTNGRAFIHVNSVLSGNTAQESRMDIVDSEVSYLGFDAAESYGLVWKVRGVETTPNIYDLVEVYGEILDSYIHHNYMGMYSFGAFGLLIDNNEVAYNYSYGIDPHDDSDELIITNNNVHDNGNHGIICSRRCNDLIITDNMSYRNRHGIMLHRDTNNTLVANNVVYDNVDTGIVLFESHNNLVTDNVVTGNAQGVRLSLGSHDNIIEHNVIEDSIENGIYQFSGSDLPETTNGRPSGNIYRYNTLRNNGRLIKLRDSDDTLFTENTFEGATDIEIYTSTGIRLENNITLFNTIEIRVDGVAGSPSSVSLDLAIRADVKMTPYATLELFSSTGQLLDAEEQSDTAVFTAVDEDGETITRSSLVLTSAIIGSSTVVTPRPFWVSLPSGSVALSDFDVLTAPFEWDAVALSGAPQVSYRIGGLQSGSDYNFRKDNKLLATVPAVGGEIQVQDAAVTQAHTYRLMPVSP